jgi:hypothetical protein
MKEFIKWIILSTVVFLFVNGMPIAISIGVTAFCLYTLAGMAILVMILGKLKIKSL